MSDTISRVTEPFVPGETIRRAYNSTYPAYVAERRKNGFPLDDAFVCNIEIITNTLTANTHARLSFDDYEAGQLDDALAHLHDAGNVFLPDNVRIQHFDIAGSKMWNIITHAMEVVKRAPSSVELALHVWQKAGGL